MKGVWIIVALGVCFWAWYGLGRLVMSMGGEVSLTNALEASGAFFTALAFFVGICTLWFQKEDLRLQREELQATRAELKGQKEQLEIQNNSITLQNFENTLFRLLGIHKEFSDNLENDEINSMTRMRFEYERIHSFPEWSTVRSDRGVHDTECGYIDVYDKHADIYESGDIRHILRLLHSIFGHISESKFVDDGKKMFYYNILMAQMSEYQCAILALHVAGKNGPSYIETAIEEYELFSDFRLDMLKDEIKRYFEASAFGLDSWPEPSPTQQP